MNTNFSSSRWCKSMEILRLDKDILKIIKDFNDKKIIAATCSAVMLLISAKNKNKNVSECGKMTLKMQEKVLDKPCVVDENNYFTTL